MGALSSWNLGNLCQPGVSVSCIKISWYILYVQSNTKQLQSVFSAMTQRWLKSVTWYVRNLIFGGERNSEELRPKPAIVVHDAFEDARILVNIIFPYIGKV